MSIASVQELAVVNSRVERCSEDRFLATGFQRELSRTAVELHQQLVKSLDWRSPTASADQVLVALKPVIVRRCEQICEGHDSDKLEWLIRATESEFDGVGPLSVLLDDNEVTDILVNGSDSVYIERRGVLFKTDIQFVDDAHLVRLIQRIVARVGRRIDSGMPTVDARLADGSRVHAILPPLSTTGPTLSIRKFGKQPLRLGQLVERSALTRPMERFLASVVEAKQSVLISGGTGAGKTTLLNALSAAIPRDERLVTIEDSKELQLNHPHVISLETRTANIEGEGEVTIRDLVKTSLRMRPDRILLGEVRGEEAVDLLQALNTGHDGSLCTIHANSARDALSRLEVMVGLARCEFPTNALRKYIASAIKIIVHVERLKGGVRRVTEVVEIESADEGEYRLRPLFGFRQLGIADEQAFGEFFSVGNQPLCAPALKALGLRVNANDFEAAVIHDVDPAFIEAATNR